MRQIREFGEAVVVIDQEPSKLSNLIKANTYCKIVFNLGNGKDILSFAHRDIGVHVIGVVVPCDYSVSPNTNKIIR